MGVAASNDGRVWKYFLHSKAAVEGRNGFSDPLLKGWVTCIVSDHNSWRVVLLVLFVDKNVFSEKVFNLGESSLKQMLRISSSEKLNSKMLCPIHEQVVIRAYASQSEKLSVWDGSLAVSGMKGFEVKEGMGVCGLAVEVGLEVSFLEVDVQVEEGNVRHICI